MDEFKKIVADTKSKKQHVLIFFEDDKVMFTLNSIFFLISKIIKLKNQNHFEKLGLKLISNIPFIEKKLAIYSIQNPNEDLAKYLKVSSYPNMVLLMHENEDKAR